jgi:hypothetical protein
LLFRREPKASVRSALAFGSRLNLKNELSCSRPPASKETGDPLLDGDELALGTHDLPLYPRQLPLELLTAKL